RRRLQEERRAKTARKVSATLRDRRNVRDQDSADELAHALEIAEEEGVIFDDPSPGGKTVLVTAEDRFVRVGGRRWREQVARVQRFVAQELECSAVQVIRPCFGRQIDDSAVKTTELGGWRVDLDLELLDGVDHWVKGDLPRLRLQG